MRLQQPTRGQCGPHYRPPIWPCSRRGLPCHGCCQPCGALLPHHFTLTSRAMRGGGMLSVALSVGSHRPGVTWRPALRSPDFPLPGWDGANQRRPLGLTAIARLTPTCHLTTKTGVRSQRLVRGCGELGGVLCQIRCRQREAFCRLLSAFVGGGGQSRSHYDHAVLGELSSLPRRTGASGVAPRYLASLRDEIFCRLRANL